VLFRSLTDALQDDGAMVLSLAPDGTVLLREPGALVFLGLKYSLSV